MSTDNCRTCNADNRDEIEAVAAKALTGELSWRKVTELVGYTHHAGLKTHMERHYHPPALGPSYEEFMAGAVGPTLAGLEAQLRVAPPELAALLAVAMHNLAGLAGTKPSQANLIAALKAVNEITGMKMEQRLMLEFAQAANVSGFFQPSPKGLPSGVVDAEIVEEDEE